MSSNRTNGTKPAIQHTKSILNDRRIRLLLAIVGAIVAWMMVTTIHATMAPSTDSASRMRRSSRRFFFLWTAGFAPFVLFGWLLIAARPPPSG